MRLPRHLRTPLVLAALLAAPIGCGDGGTSTPGNTPPPDGDPSSASTALTADHSTVDPSSIPSAALEAASALRMHLLHASVGENIWSGLGTLAGADVARYAHPTWSETNRGNPGWALKVSGFTSFVAAHAAEYDVFQMKLCYIDQDASYTAYRDAMLALEAAYPTKTFIWWTIPLMETGSDNALRAAFNQQVRAHCAAHDKPLFDIADIESHDASGLAVTAAGNEAMAHVWSSDGGHLNAAGSVRVAGAMWWLMARIGGWNGQ